MQDPKAIRKALYASGGDVESDSQPDDNTTTRLVNQNGLYSHAAEAAQALKQEKGPPQQMIASLKGVKPDELYWSGVHNAFRDRKSITKQELADHFHNALPKMNVETLTSDSGSVASPKAKFDAWTAERKMRSSKQPYNFKNYREVLNTLPLSSMNASIGNDEDSEKYFKSGHWNDPNIVSHIRLSDRESMPPKQKIPKRPQPDSVVKRSMGLGHDNYKQTTVAYSTPHKNIFITPSVQKRGKYVLTHGPSGSAISSDPIDFYHAMDRATKLNEKLPHVFDFNDKDGINNYIKDPKNEKEVDTVRELLKSPPPDLPMSKKAKEFSPEKILHVEESQSDFGQAFRKHTDKVNEYKQELKRLDDEINNHKSEIERISKEKPHLANDQNRAIYKDEFDALWYPNIDEMTQQRENFDKDKEDWQSLYSHNSNVFNKESARRTTQNLLSSQEALLSKLPKSPYVDNTSKWTDLNVKQILTQAAKGDYDKVIWTPGSVHSKIYGIGNSYSGITYNPQTKRLMAIPKKRSKAINHMVEPQDLPNYIGEALTKKLLEPDETFKSSGIHSLTGKGLDVPNAGQEGYYGKIFPRRLIELAREHDPEAQLSAHKDNDKLVDGYPALKITPKMRASILKNGFKAYKTGGYIDDSSILSAAQDPNKAIRKALMIAKRFSKKND